MEIGIALGLGMLIGYVVTAIARPKYEVIGTIKSIADEDGETYLFLDLDQPVECIYAKDYVTMKVSHK